MTAACQRITGPDGWPLSSLREINALSRKVKEDIYRQLVPARVWSLLDFENGGEVRIVAPEGLGLLRIEARRARQDRDYLFFVELADTFYAQIELSFCLINDLDGPRFDIDRDPQGRPNDMGTTRRNIPEELRAMQAGLSPNQVRPGLGLFNGFFQQLQDFVPGLGLDTIVAEPLSYNNAIRYERYGFDYLSGRRLMEWINHEFRPGGELWRKLDGSTPFRQRGMEASVRGRSWAIHDGILPNPWDGVKIYKTIGYDAGIDTFPHRQF
jgi:hypothetical protein